MAHKIQPKQIELHTFSAPSGNLRFEQGEDFVKGYLEEDITGDFNVIGNLSITGQNVLVPSLSNKYGGTDVFCLGGQTNVVSGERNIVVNGLECEVSGEGNLVLQGQYNKIDSSVAGGTILAGAYGYVGHDGAVVIGDQTASAKDSFAENSLLFSFTGGTVFQEDVYFADPVVHSGDVLVESGATLNLTGDLNAEGDIFQSGGRVAAEFFVTGITTPLASNVELTGSGLYEDAAWRQASIVRTTGSQTVNGEKTFGDDLLIELGEPIRSTGATSNDQNFILVDSGPITNVTTGQSVTVASQNSFHVVVDHDNDYFTGGDFYQFKKNDSFAVFCGAYPVTSATDCLFSVNPSGIARAWRNVVMEDPIVPATASDTGLVGMTAWDTNYWYVCVALNTWKRAALTTW